MIFALLLTLSGDAVPLAENEWIVESYRNDYGYYVHSRKIVDQNISCLQTRLGTHEDNGILKPPSHILWEPSCQLPLAVINAANQDVIGDLRSLRLYVNGEKEWVKGKQQAPEVLIVELGKQTAQ